MSNALDFTDDEMDFTDQATDYPAIHEKLIVMYSLQGGVGQTTTAVMLADTLAQQGANVLLIDWATRNEGARTLGLPVTQGLRNFLKKSGGGDFRARWVCL